MKQKPNRRTSLLLGFLTLLFFLVGTFLGLRTIWRLLTSAQAPLAAAVVAGSATILVSMLSVVVGKYLESRAKIREEHRQKKVPVYEELIQFLFRALFAQKLGREPLSDKEVIEFFSEFTPKLVIWGATEVVLAFGDFREFTLQLAESEQPVEVTFIYERVLLEIRKDLGHNIAALKKGDLLRLFITDIRKYI